MGVIVLDEAAFQHQGFKLAAGDDVVKVPDLAHHPAGLVVMAGVFPEVADHPVFQRLSLAHIDDLSLFVFHQVTARLHGQAQGFGFQFFNGQGSTSFVGWTAFIIVEIQSGGKGKGL